MKSLQLSISLLASDRPAALERCLDSLKPLLMQVPSELIVVTTGTDVRIREIVSGYTDQIVPFTWCDDFSAARNAGMRVAQGEWFLYLDDDEWFEDTFEIVRFFQSGEYCKFGVAVYNIRNYIDWDGITYSNSKAPRLVKLVPGSHFINPIHEELIPRPAPCKYLDTYVHHYGYVKDQKKIGTQKASRNIPLILEDIRKRPSYAKNYVQIVQEYRHAHDWDKAEEYCRKGLKHCRKLELVPFRRWLLADLIEILYAKGNYKKAKDEIFTILEQYKPCELIRLVAYLTLNKIYIKLGNPEESLHYGIQYEEVLAYMDDNPVLWRQQECGNLSEMRVKRPNVLYQIRTNCLEQALACGNMEQAIYFLSLLPWEDETKIQGFYHIFDYLKDRYSNLFRDILKEFPADSPYLLFQQTINVVNTDKAVKQKSFELCMQKTNSYHLQYQVVKEAILLEIDISKIATVFELDEWKQCVAELVSDLSDIGLSKAWKAKDTLKNYSLLHSLLFEKSLRQRELMCKYLAGKKFIMALNAYIDCTLSYYRKQYCTEMFREEQSKLLPKECRFVIALSDALKKLEHKEYPEAIQMLRVALTLDSSMTGIVHEIIRLIANRINNPACNATEEFKTLAIQMKNALNTMIQCKQYEQAVPVMQQLCSLLPDDLELLRLRQKLLREINIS